jgi:perosamine synthetase
MIEVNKPKIEDQDIRAVTRCLHNGWISGESPEIEEFEKKWASYCDRKYGIAVANGTVALDLAIEILDLDPGDEIILPTFTIISCINAILRNKLIPIFVDSKIDTWNIDADAIEGKITQRTRAILVPHIYGLPADMDKILRLSKKYHLRIIEDAAESHGLRYNERICGSFGLVSTFSFYSNKTITSGEGGMLLTNNLQIANRLRNLRNLNFRKNARFKSEQLGYNYRLGSMQAALASSQIDRIESIIKRKRQIAAHYDKNLHEKNNIQIPVKQNEFGKNSYWVYGVLLRGKFKGKANSIRSTLKNLGIDTRPFFQPLHSQPVLKKYGLSCKEKFPIATELSVSGFYLPNGLDLKYNEQEYVSKCLLDILKN